MPVLAPETAWYPADLLGEDCGALQGRQWWAVYTKARQEKSLARDLLGQQVPFYLPLVSKRLVERQRKVISRVPLFAGYLFLLGDDGDRLQCLKTNRVCQIIPVVDQQQLVVDLRNVFQLIASDVPLAIEARLAPGQRVRVKKGMFQGLEGTVLSATRPWRLVVAVNFLQQGVSLEIDEVDVERLE